LIMNKTNSDRVSLNKLQKKVARFRDERNWRQYHNPKNLVLSILIEAAELAEHFQWETPDEAEKHGKNVKKKHEIAMELADVLIYCLQLADVTGIDPGKAILEKLDFCEKKFPKEMVGNERFYNQQHRKYRRQKKKYRQMGK